MSALNTDAILIITLLCFMEKATDTLRRGKIMQWVDTDSITTRRYHVCRMFYVMNE